MKILYDSQIFDNQLIGGISTMFCELYKNDLVIDNIESTISVIQTHNIPFKELNILPDNINNISNKQYSIECLKKQNFDIFYPTFFDRYFLEYLNNKPFVMSVHDMIPELYPLYFSHEDLLVISKKILCPIASAIEVPTQCTKNDLINILNIDPKKIHIVGRGASTLFDTIKTNKPLYDFKYVLYIGERNIFKNFDLFLKEISPFIHKHSDIKIICTGKPFNYNELQLIIKYNLLNNIFVKMYTTTGLCNLYLHALCFVYSSDYEGFGIPILEAYKSNCIVLLNDIKCFREVAGDTAIFFNIKHEGDLNNKLEYVNNMSLEEKNILLMKQKERDKLYSWAKVGQNLFNMYKLVLDQNK